MFKQVVHIITTPH